MQRSTRAGQQGQFLLQPAHSTRRTDVTTLRDFITFIGDIVTGVSWNEGAYDVFNLSGGERVQLMEGIRELVEVLSVKARSSTSTRCRGMCPGHGEGSSGPPPSSGSGSTSLVEGIRPSRDWFEAIARSPASAVSS